MSQECKGTEIVMPSKELERIGSKLFKDIAKDEVKVLEDSLEMAWGLIANSYGGDWDKATDEWRNVAEKWRKEWFEISKVE